MTSRWARAAPHGALILLGLAFSIAFFVTLRLHSDNVQILDKAIALRDHGQFTHHGSAATSVGFVPGSFLTAVTAGPMMLWFSPYAALAVIAAFHALSLALIALILGDLGRPRLTLDLVLVYWLNPWRVEPSQLYNPAYLFLFSALHFWTAHRMRERRFWLSAAHVLTIGLCAQVHYSFAILALLSLLLWWLRFLRVHWGGAALGAGLVLLSLVPYLLEYAQDARLAVTAAPSGERFVGRNLLLVFPVAKALAYWVRFGSTYFPRPIFSEVDFAWLGGAAGAASVAFALFKWPLAAATLIWSAAVNVRALGPVLRSRPLAPGIDRTGGPPAGRIAAYAFYMLLATLAAVALSPVQMVHWHLLLCFPVVAALGAIAFNALRDRLSPGRFAACFAGVLALFAIFNVLGFMGSRMHSMGPDFHREFMDYYERQRR